MEVIDRPKCHYTREGLKLRQSLSHYFVELSKNQTDQQLKQHRCLQLKVDEKISKRFHGILRKPLILNSLLPLNFAR